MPELGHRALDKRRDRVDFTQVSRQAQKTAAQRSHTLNGFRRFDNINAHDIAARFCKTQRHTLTKTGIATGNDRDFTLKRECIENHVCFLVIGPVCDRRDVIRLPAVYAFSSPQDIDAIKRQVTGGPTPVALCHLTMTAR
ncbi:hypothetical protein BN130_2023 [Cronobacter malonaticus 507]|nr:hypothetical protein BN130_2023 [Cronobacter malonaticus 507]